ncbi:MAG: hypothetical protein KKE17_10695 [Proteobacteria bacterium]|nr:hypothetical protein [Pseudomonadota bacterium]MBU1710460.1 hypothetical protein [Pseudomonadota bacterium]
MRKKILPLFVVFLLVGCVAGFQKGPEWFSSQGIQPENINSQQSIHRLIELLNSEDQQTQKTAFNILRHGQPAPKVREGEVISEEPTYLVFNQPKLTPEIAEALAGYSQRIGAPHVFSTASYLTEEKLGKYSVPGLMDALNSPSAGIRSNAAIWLGKIGQDAAPALPILEIISKNDRRRVQANAKVAIRKIQVDGLLKDQE